MGIKLTELLEQFDYISAYWGLLLILFVPLLRTKSVLDLFVIPAWIYATLCACGWFLYHQFPATVKLALMYDQMFFLAVLAGFVLLLKSEIDCDKIRSVLGWIGIVNLALSAASIFFDQPFISGLVPNKAMNGILNVILMPYTCQLLGLFGWFVNAGLLFSYHSSTALLTFCAVWLFSIPNWKLGVWVVFCSFLISAKYIPHVLYDGGRFYGYKFFFQKHEFLDWLFGMGPSSYFSIGTWMQKKYGLPGGEVYWVYMHSDPIQYLFEYGTIGLFLGLFVLWSLFYKARHLERLALVGIVTGGIFYYPIHFPVHLIVVLLVLKLIHASPVKLLNISSHIS